MTKGRNKLLFLLGLGTLWSGQTAVCAQSGGGTDGSTADSIEFVRDWPVQATPYYRITVRADGTGSITTTQPGRAAGESGTPAGSADSRPAPIGSEAVGGSLRSADPSGPIHVSEATRTKLFSVAPVLASAKGCESGSKHTALTGAKTLVLRRGGTELRCSFNRSEDKRVEEAVSLFSAIELTAEEGPKLKYLRRYDRLGLDAELGTFLGLVKDGRAIELVNLEPVLRTLAGDGELMDRVRSRAEELLALAEAGK